MREFGEDVLHSAPTVLPTPEFFPDPYDGSDESVRLIVDRVCGYMGVSPERVDVAFFSAPQHLELINEAGHAVPTAAGLYEEGDRCTIHLDDTQFDKPSALVGTVAHELAHMRLMGEKRLPPTYDNELVTDLTVVFHGLGIFTANDPRHWRSDASTWPGTDVYRPEYMTTPMLGYALALRCLTRREALPKWRKYLEPGARAEFKAAYRFLQSNRPSTDAAS